MKVKPDSNKDHYIDVAMAAAGEMTGVIPSRGIYTLSLTRVGLAKSVLWPNMTITGSNSGFVTMATVAYFVLNQGAELMGRSE